MPIIVALCHGAPMPERGFAQMGERRHRLVAWTDMAERLAPRLRALPRVDLGDVRVPVARGFRARLLGLAWLEREEAGAGLLIPRCSRVHTFGMRFPLLLAFFDEHGGLLATRHVLPRRFVSHRDAVSVLELPCRGRV